MTDFPGGVTALTLLVEDLAVSRDFYDRAFGLDPIHVDDASTAYSFGGTVVNLLEVSAGFELLDPAQPGPAGVTRAVVSIAVDDVDAVAAGLVERGIELLNGPVDRPWGLRTASFRDPSGHVWEICA